MQLKISQSDVDTLIKKYGTLLWESKVAIDLDYQTRFIRWPLLIRQKHKKIKEINQKLQEIKELEIKFFGTDTVGLDNLLIEIESPWIDYFGALIPFFLQRRTIKLKLKHQRFTIENRYNQLKKMLPH